VNPESDGDVATCVRPRPAARPRLLLRLGPRTPRRVRRCPRRPPARVVRCACRRVRSRCSPEPSQPMRAPGRRRGPGGPSRRGRRVVRRRVRRRPPAERLPFRVVRRDRVQARRGQGRRRPCPCQVARRPGLRRAVGRPVPCQAARRRALRPPDRPRRRRRAGPHASRSPCATSCHPPTPSPPRARPPVLLGPRPRRGPCPRSGRCDRRTASPGRSTVHDPARPRR